jgi:hypothetical protein
VCVTDVWMWLTYACEYVRDLFLNVTKVCLWICA